MLPQLALAPVFVNVLSKKQVCFRGSNYFPEKVNANSGVYLIGLVLNRKTKTSFSFWTVSGKHASSYALFNLKWYVSQNSYF